jgi:GT2 family glycosyltransferase
MSVVTIGITTRDRPRALSRLVDSLALLSEFEPQVIVFDDGSTPAASHTLAGLSTRLRIRIIRDETGAAYIVGRNRIMSEASTPFVLLLDDDAVILDVEPVRTAIALLERDPTVAAVAFAQAEADGRPWPVSMQPGGAGVPSLVPSYIGFAHLLRADAFRARGGYRELLAFYGEEKELCVRLWNEGQKVVYLPDALIAHVPDSAARSQSRYVRYAIRNDCLFSILNEPLPLPLVSIPVRLRRYLSMARTVDNGDAGGLRWLIADLLRSAPEAWRLRRAVSWKTLRYWRHLGRNAVPYIAP